MYENNFLNLISIKEIFIIRNKKKVRDSGRFYDRSGSEHVETLTKMLAMTVAICCNSIKKNKI